jgi:Secretion system C-terminal sorting domain
MIRFVKQNLKVMKKILLLVFVLFGLKSEAQLNFQVSNFNDSLGFYNCYKSVKFHGEIYFLLDNWSVYKYDSTIHALSLLQRPIENQNVNDIAVDSFGNLILLNNSQNGYDNINFFDGTSWHDYHHPSYGVTGLYGLLVDSANTIFTYSRDSLFTFKNGVWNQFKLNFTNPNEQCRGLIAGPNHECVLYSSQPLGLYSLYNIYKLSGQTLIPFISNLSESGQFTFDRNNNFYYVHADSIVKISPSNVVTVYNNANSPIVNQSDYLLFAVNPAGTMIWRNNYFYNGNSWTQYTNLASINFMEYMPNNELFIAHPYLIEEYSNNIFKRSYNHIFSYIDHPNCFQVFSDQYLPYLIGSNNGLWLNGANNYNKANTPMLLSDTILSIEHIFCSNYYYSTTLLYSTDTFCVGTNKGFFQLKIANNTLYVLGLCNVANGKLLSDTVNSILLYTSSNPSREKTIWVGTNNGVAKFNSDLSAVKFYTKSNSILPSNHIQKITASLDDSIIIFCTDSGFSTLYGNTMQTYTTSNSGLSNNDVRDVGAKGSINNYYYEVATMGGGISIDSIGSWRTISKSNGNYFSDSINYVDDKRIVGFSQGMEKAVGMKDTGLYAFGSYTGALYNQFNGVKASNFFDYSITLSDLSSGACAYFTTLTTNEIVIADFCDEGISNIQKSNSEFTTYLNSNTLNIRWNELKEGHATIQLYDVLGRKVFEKNVSATENFCKTEIPNLPSAMYFVHVQQQEKSHSGKIMWVE